jgi:hypothetical protein
MRLVRNRPHHMQQQQSLIFMTPRFQAYFIARSQARFQLHSQDSLKYAQCSLLSSLDCTLSSTNPIVRDCTPLACSCLLDCTLPSKLPSTLQSTLQSTLNYTLPSMLPRSLDCTLSDRLDAETRWAAGARRRWGVAAGCGGRGTVGG